MLPTIRLIAVELPLIFETVVKPVLTEPCAACHTCHNVSMSLSQEILLATGLAVVAAIAIDWWRKPPSGTPPSGKKGGFTFTVDYDKK